jgi:hypothetical protein
MHYRQLLRFAGLFGGRTDAYFRSLDKGGLAVWRQVGLHVFNDHLTGASEVGTYPVTDLALCRWGCIDIDMPDDEAKAWQLASDLVSVWKFFGVTAWCERSRSKGFHVWVFCEQWTSAQTMRDAGRWAALLAELPPKTEVNPKNAAPWLTRTGLVNTVRTPYSGQAAPGRMVMVDDDGAPVSIEDFTDCAYALRTKPMAVAGMARSMRQVDERQARRVELEADSYSSSMAASAVLRGTARNQQTAARIVAGTATAEVGERDHQFFTVAKYLYATNVPYEVALSIVRKRWAQCDTTDFPLSVALEKVNRIYGQ